MAETKIIYIADDDDNIRQIIRTFLSSDGYEIEDFLTGDLLLERFAQRPCDLVILDVMMPGSDGFTVCTELRKSSTVPIIMLTARDSENDFAMGLGLGSDDYITKPFSPAELIARVDALIRRLGVDEAEKDSVEVHSGPFLLNSRNRTLEKNGTRLKLTQIEYLLVKLFMENPGRAMSREEILKAVWGADFDGELKTVDVNIRRLRMKIEDDPTEPEYLTTVWGYGYKWGY